MISIENVMRTFPIERWSRGTAGSAAIATAMLVATFTIGEIGAQSSFPIGS